MWRTNFDRQLEGYSLASAVREPTANQDAKQGRQPQQPPPQQQQQQPPQQPNAAASSGSSGARAAPGALRSSGGSLMTTKRPGSAHAAQGQQQQRKAAAAAGAGAVAVAATADPSAYAAGRYTEIDPEAAGDDLVTAGDANGVTRVTHGMAQLMAGDAAGYAAAEQRAAAAEQRAAAAEQKADAAAAAAVGQGAGPLPDALARMMRDIVFKLDHIATVSLVVDAVWWWSLIPKINQPTHHTPTNRPMKPTDRPNLIAIQTMDGLHQRVLSTEERLARLEAAGGQGGRRGQRDAGGYEI